MAVLAALNKVEGEVADGAFEEGTFSKSDRWVVWSELGSGGCCQCTAVSLSISATRQPAHAPSYQLQTKKLAIFYCQGCAERAEHGGCRRAVRAPASSCILMTFSKHTLLFIPRDALSVLSMEVADALSARALEVSFASAMSVVAANGASTHNMHLAHMMRAQLLDYYGG